MKTRRTTITLSEEAYEALRKEAYETRKSMSEIINQKITSMTKKESAQKKLQEAYVLFDKIANSGPAFDPVKAVREDRDRDDT